jgi:hypothetical protein
MKQSHGWMKWMSALVVSAGATACGVTVSEPIQSSQSAVSPLEAALLVKDLSPSEATAWCTWYVMGPSNTSAALDDPDSLAVSSGFTCPGSSGVIRGAGASTLLCATRPSIEQCVQNLQRSPCEAPIAELDVCVAMMFAPVDTAPSNDCDAFRARTGCEETVVQDVANRPSGEPASACDGRADSGPSCRIPVE